MRDFLISKADLGLDQKSHSMESNSQKTLSSCAIQRYQDGGSQEADEHNSNHKSHSSKCLTSSSVTTVEGRILLQEKKD